MTGGMLFDKEAWERYCREMGTEIHHPLDHDPAPIKGYGDDGPDSHDEWRRLNLGTD